MIAPDIREMTDAGRRRALHPWLMFYLVLIIVFGSAAVVATLAVRPGATALRRAGVAVAVVGALTSLLMWWLRVPFLVLAAGIVMLIVDARRSRQLGVTVR
jgi:hypothetical protein